jgi:hypothetical protein
MNTTIKESLQQRQTVPGIVGHDCMSPERFAKDTQHMIVCEVLKEECPIGDQGNRMRLFLNDEDYQTALASQGRGEMKITRYARVRYGEIFFDAPERVSRI